MYTPFENSTTRIAIAERLRAATEQYYKVGHHQKEISDYMQMQTIDYGFNHFFDIVNRIDE